MKKLRKFPPNKLQRTRKIQRYNQVTIATLCGISSRSAMSDWENSYVLPSFKNAIQLSLIYEVSLEHLFSPLYAKIKQELALQGNGPFILEAPYILGLSLGTRVIGITIVRGACLFDWRTKHFKGRWTLFKLKEIVVTIEEIIQRYRPAHVVIKIPPSTNQSKHITPLIEKVVEKCARANVNTKIYYMHDIKKAFPFIGQYNKRGICRWLLEKYPELTHDYQRLCLHSDAMRIFEALAGIEVFTRSFVGHQISQDTTHVV